MTPRVGPPLLPRALLPAQRWGGVVLVTVSEALGSSLVLIPLFSLSREFYIFISVATFLHLFQGCMPLLPSGFTTPFLSRLL